MNPTSSSAPATRRSVLQVTLEDESAYPDRRSQQFRSNLYNEWVTEGGVTSTGGGSGGPHGTPGAGGPPSNGPLGSTWASSPARRLRDAAEPLAMHATGSPPVRAAMSALGLDRFVAYVWSRAAFLGTPAPEAVASAFGVFEPNTLGRAYLAGRAACSRTLLLETRDRATVASLHDTLGRVSVDEVVAQLREVMPGAPDPDRPLFDGLCRLPWPEDPLGQLWRACELFREHRGGTHLQVCADHDLDGLESNILTELWLNIPLGHYTRTRGWSDAAISGAVDRLMRRGLIRDRSLTEPGRALRTTMEVETDAGQHAVVQALGNRAERVIGRLAEWSAMCIEAGTFTSDPAKRAAG